MANLEAEIHKHLTHPGIKNCLLKSDQKMSKSYVNVVSFDDNESYLSTLRNLYKWNEQLLMKKTGIEKRTNISTFT